MDPRIVSIEEKILIGKSLKMSFANNLTASLWRSFMPFLKEIRNRKTNDLISLQIYDDKQFVEFNPNREFVKWALAEVSDLDYIPDGMNAFHLKGGKYAVFIHKGNNTDTSPFQYIFASWLPQSQYELDSRPHFEVLGEKYKNGSPDSEEELWIPIKLKSH